MNDGDKAEGLFDLANDLLSEEQILEYQKLFDRSQAKGCPLQREIISFDMAYLESEGILIAGVVNQDKLREATRNAMTALIKNSQLQQQPGNQYWIAAIHQNTDNIHIHVAMSEYEKVERRFDKLSEEALDKAKTSIHRTLSGDVLSKELSELWKHKLEPKMTFDSSATIQTIKKLIPEIPEGYTQYNRKKYSHLKPLLRKAIQDIFFQSTNLNSIWQEYLSKLEQYSESLKIAYGEDKRELWQQAALNKLENEVKQHLDYPYTEDKIMKDIRKTIYFKNISKCFPDVALALSLLGLTKQAVEYVRINEAVNKNINLLPEAMQKELINICNDVIKEHQHDP